MTVKWEEKVLIVTNMKCDCQGRSPNKTHKERIYQHQKMITGTGCKLAKLGNHCLNLANGCHQLSSFWVFLSGLAKGTKNYDYPLFAKQL